jgi:hypothetical protein
VGRRKRKRRKRLPQRLGTSEAKVLHYVQEQGEPVTVTEVSDMLYRETSSRYSQTMRTDEEVLGRNWAWRLLRQLERKGRVERCGEAPSNTGELLYRVRAADPVHPVLFGGPSIRVWGCRQGADQVGVVEALASKGVTVRRSVVSAWETGRQGVDGFAQQALRELGYPE